MHSRHKIGHSLIAFAAMLWISVSLLAASTSSYVFAISSNDVSALSNSARTSNGLAPLTTDQALTSAAQAKAEHMLANGYFAHNAPDGTTGWTFISASGYDYSTAGENLAASNQGASAVVTGWMNSPGHRANLLSATYTEVGYGVVYVGDWTYQEATYSGTYYVVALYASPAAQTATPVIENTEPAQPVAPQVSNVKSGAEVQAQPEQVQSVETPEEATGPEEAAEEIVTSIKPAVDTTSQPTASVQRHRSQSLSNFMVIMTTSTGIVAFFAGVYFELRAIKQHHHGKLALPQFVHHLV